MASLETRSFENPDQSMAPDKTDARVINFGSVAAAKVTLQPGWSWSSCIKPAVGTESCETGHIGVVTKGKLRVKHDDGTKVVIVAGEAYSLAPGHDGWVEGNETVEAYEFNNTGKTYAVWDEG